MSREPDPPLLPDDALPCIWMSAGLVAYKLCDRDYECEGCPFDEALGAAPSRREVALRAEPRRAAWEFPPDRRYAATHAWAQESDGRRLRCGRGAGYAPEIPHPRGSADNTPAWGQNGGGPGPGL